MKATESGSTATPPWPRWVRPVGIYALLLAGTALFSWPLGWMLLSSFKTEQEIARDTGSPLPDAPHPHRHSPYVDPAWYPLPADGPARALLPVVGHYLGRLDYRWPAGLDRDELIPAVARGVVRRLALAQPAAWWQQSLERQQADLGRLVTPALIDESLSQVAHSLLFGQLTVRSYDLVEDVLVTPEQQATAWHLAGSGRAGFAPEFADRAGSRLDYDFTAGSTVRLTRTLTTRFAVNRLHQIKLFVRGDASWNHLRLTVEMNGRRLEAVRPAVLSDTRWLELAWQEPGPDEQSNKVRTWILLRETARGPGLEADPHRLKLTLELTRSGRMTAWWDKLSQNYQLIWRYMPFGRYVATSLFVAILQLSGTLLSCSLVAYSFARLKWPGRRLCWFLMIATMIVPSQVTMIPHFVVMRALGWYNTLYPLWVSSFFANAFFVFLLHQFLKGIPRDLEHAALIDGCGYWRIYWHVILPLIRPSLATIAILTFLGAWNDFATPLVYLNDQRLYPLSFGLYALNIQSGGVMGLMMAGSVLMTLPVIAIFFFAQRYFIQGITLTGMK